MHGAADSGTGMADPIESVVPSEEGDAAAAAAAAGTGMRGTVELVSPSEDGDLDATGAPVAGTTVSAGSQVDTFLRGEAGEGDPAAGPPKSSGAKETAVVEAKWSDFQFSKVESFSDFLYDLGEGQVHPQPVTHPPPVRGLDSGWPGTAASAADADGPVTLEEQFASELNLHFPDIPGYWEDTSDSTSVHEVQHVSHNAAAGGGGASWQEQAVGVYNELPTTGMVDGYHLGSGVSNGGSSLSGGGQYLETANTPLREQGSGTEYVDPNLYYQDPEHPGWIYCYQTAQWLAKTVYANDKHEHGAEPSAATQKDQTSSKVQEELAGAAESVNASSPDPWDRVNAGSSSTFPAAYVSKDSLFADNTSSPASQGRRSSVSRQGSEEVPAVLASSEATANGGGHVQEGRGYDPNYPGWYYDYRSEQWFTDTQQDAASQGQHTWATEQERQGAVEPMQGNMYAGEQGQGFPYHTPTRDQQAQFQPFVPVSQGQYGGFPDGRLKAHGNGHALAGYNGQPWSTTQPSPLVKNSSQPGAGLSGNPTPYLRNDSEYSQEHAPVGWTNGFSSGQTANSMHGNHYPHQYPYDQQNAYQQQQQPPMNSGFFNYEQPWGLNPQYQHAHNQSWSPHISIPKTTAEGVRTSAGRPPHALCAFGFGGKFVIMKHRDPLRLQTSNGEQSIASGQAWTPSAVQLLNLFQLVSPTVESGHKAAGSLYFESLTRRTYSGPLVGGSVSSKELIRWIEEREKVCKEEVKSCKLEDLHRKNLESLSDLWSVLRIMCQHHGKLRSTVGTTGITLQEADGPEVALANILASGTVQSGWTMGFSTPVASLQITPSEQQLQKTAADMTKLLIAGKRKDALQHATEGQLWGPALLLAGQLGEKFYGDTVIEMSRSLLVAGSPLRTLSLLLAGQPASEVFAGKVITTSATASPYIGAPSAGARDTTQDAIHRMMEEWRANLAIMSANRTNGDDRVMMYLGDCLSEMRQEVEAAHICYLVADSNFESFSHTARLCLLGANHRLYPRTYVTPEAIQRTELYEHAKVLGNPQFFLPQFQPYKLVYAYMLVEAGKTTEALRYCQAILKMLKMAGRSPEVETCRQAAASLEERIKFHTNSGSNSVPKLFQGISTILKTMDKGISGIIGGAPPPMSSEPYPNVGVENGGKIPVPSDASWQTASLLVPSPSVDPLNGLIHGNDRKNRPSRSVSEPDFSKSPKGQEASEPQSAVSKSPAKGGPSNSVFARFGSNILQRAVFFVGKTTKEAKLGEKNKFYYDEKLKRWVEEGAELPAEEAVLAPPPIAAKFVTPVEESSVNPPAGLTLSSGTPPVPPSANQFSVRSRQGVRSRYVDTLSKGGNSTPQKSSVSSLVTPPRPSAPQAMSFFVPAPVASPSSDFLSAELDGGQANSDVSGNSGQSNQAGSYYGGGLDPGAFREQERPGQRNSHSVPPAAPSMHRVGSVDNAVGFSSFSKADGGGRALNQSRTKSGSVAMANGSHTRAASWGGYPSSYGSVVETGASSHLNSPGLPAPADYSVPGTISSASKSSSHGGSYFVPPSSHMDVEPNLTSQLVNASLPLPPPIEAHRAAPVVNGLPLVHMGTIQNGDLGGVTLNAEEMQEVEL